MDGSSYLFKKNIPCSSIYLQCKKKRIRQNRNNWEKQKSHRKQGRQYGEPARAVVGFCLCPSTVSIFLLLRCSGQSVAIHRRVGFLYWTVNSVWPDIVFCRAPQMFRARLIISKRSCLSMKELLVFLDHALDHCEMTRTLGLVMVLPLMPLRKLSAFSCVACPPQSQPSLHCLHSSLRPHLRDDMFACTHVCAHTQTRFYLMHQPLSRR